MTKKYLEGLSGQIANTFQHARITHRVETESDFLKDALRETVQHCERLKKQIVILEAEIIHLRAYRRDSLRKKKPPPKHKGRLQLRRVESIS